MLAKVSRYTVSLLSAHVPRGLLHKEVMSYQPLYFMLTHKGVYMYSGEISYFES